MSIEWFRHYHGAIYDGKIFVVASLAGCKRHVASIIWMAILEHASASKNRGSIDGFNPKMTALALELDVDTVERVVAAMRECDLIASDGRITNWEKRQPKREDSSAERTREWRERKAAAATQRDASVTQRDAPVTNGDAAVTHGDDAVTQRDAPVTQCDAKRREEKIREEGEGEGEGVQGERERDAPAPSSPAAPPEAAPPKEASPSKRVRTHKPLALDDEMLAWARQNAPDVGNLEREMGKYLDWLKRKGRQDKDQRAGFRNWLRKAQEDAEARRAAEGAGTLLFVDPHAQERNRMRSWRDTGIWLPSWGPPPTEPGCWIHPDVLREFGVDPAIPQDAH